MLALIAGKGALPELLYEALQKRGETPLVSELDGFPSGLTGSNPTRFRTEQLATYLSGLKDAGVTELCMAGRIARPVLDPDAVDEATKPYVARIARAISAGDDGALREIILIIEEFGISLRAAHEVLPELLPPSGVQSTQQPSARDHQDAARAEMILGSLGAADLGQACVVAAGQALAVETLGGSDWMLRTLGDGNRPGGPAGGLFFKAPKPNQDRRVDLPVIGPATVIAAQAAGLDGIVIETGGVMVLNLPDVIASANNHQMFLWVRDNGE